MRDERFQRAKDAAHKARHEGEKSYRYCDDIAEVVIDAYLGDEPLYRIANEQETARPGTEWHSIRLVQVWPVKVDDNEG